VLPSRPKNAQRTDGAIMTIPAPKFSRAKKSLTVTTPGPGEFVNFTLRKA
jgi:hypothetical protein